MKMNIKQEATWRQKADDLLEKLRGDKVKKDYLAVITSLINQHELEQQKEFKNNFDLGVNQNVARAVLRNLHKHQSILVSSDIRQTKPRANTPVVTIAHTILTDPKKEAEMVGSSWTDFRVNIDALHYLQNKLEPRSIKTVADIFYYQKPGIGWVSGLQFKFKDHTEEYRIFEELYAHLNDRVERKRVLDLSDHKQGTNPSDYVNDLVKEIRKKTKLTTTQLVNNNGNLTLVGNKLNEPPLP